MKAKKIIVMLAGLMLLMTQISYGGLMSIKRRS